VDKYPRQLCLHGPFPPSKKLRSHSVRYRR
jgi:hypothetical protein